jgi:hypothetical protein
MGSHSLQRASTVSVTVIQHDYQNLRTEPRSTTGFRFSYAPAPTLRFVPSVVGSPRPGPTLRFVPCLVRAFAGAFGHPRAVRCPRSLRSSGGDCRPPSGRPLRVRRPVPVAPSAPDGCPWSGRSKSTAPPAGLRRARLREARGLSSCGLSVGWCGSGWLSPSPGPGGNQTSAGSATGGSVGSWWVLSSPVALPAEARSGFACQARGTTNLGGSVRCASAPPQLMHHRVMLRTQQRQILHRGRPAIPERGLVMRMQRPRRRPSTSRIGAMPIPKHQRDPLSPTRQPRPRITVNHLPVQQHRLTTPGLQQMPVRRRNRSTRNQHTINRRSQLIGIKRSSVKNLSAK